MTRRPGTLVHGRSAWRDGQRAEAGPAGCRRLCTHVTTMTTIKVRIFRFLKYSKNHLTKHHLVSVLLTSFSLSMQPSLCSGKSLNLRLASPFQHRLGGLVQEEITPSTGPLWHFVKTYECNRIALPQRRALSTSGSNCPTELQF